MDAAIPDDQRPGHHPDVEQDKPAPTRLPPGSERTFAFAFDPVNLALSTPLGITPWTTRLTVTSSALVIRFGPWSLATPLDNVTDARKTGPYRLIKVAGGPHLSLADHGVTFATRLSEGVCITFRRAVPAILPFRLGLLKHPAATVTIAKADELIDLLTG